MILDQKNDQQQQVDIYLVVRREKCHRRFVLDRLKRSREDDAREKMMFWMALERKLSKLFMGQLLTITHF